MKRFGRRLGVMLLVLVLICVTVGVAALLGGFGDDGLMARLLLKPGHIIVERRPEVAGAVTKVIDRMLATASALCHGDYSPKNILTHSQGFTLVDYETAHWGDPTMDLGFFLSHLLLKAVKRHAERG